MWVLTRIVKIATFFINVYNTHIHVIVYLHMVTFWIVSSAEVPKFSVGRNSHMLTLVVMSPLPYWDM